MYFLVGKHIYNSKELTYLKEENVYIVWKKIGCYDDDGNPYCYKYVDQSFHGDEIEKASEDVFDLVEEGDLILVNGNNNKPYINGAMWIPFIATEDTIKEPSAYFEGWHKIKIYKPNRRETSYHLAWESE